MRSKLIALIMACCMTFVLLPLNIQAENHIVDYAENEGTLAASFFQGEGTEENPYILSTPRHFSILALMVNRGESQYAQAYYRLANSIDFSGVSYVPIGKQETILDFPGEGDFAMYKKGKYILSSGISAVVDTEYGQIDVSHLFSSASVEISDKGKADATLNFTTADINLSDEVTATFFVSDSYGVDGVKTDGTIGYKNSADEWLNYGTASVDVISVKKSSTGTVVPSYTLEEGVSGVKYVKQISLHLDEKKSEYSLAFAIDSNVLGAQLGEETGIPVTLNVDWTKFTAPIYTEDEYVEKVSQKYPFSGHLDGNGYALKNITIDTSEGLVGVFGLGYNACVKNLRIENININAERKHTLYVGALFGCYEGNWKKEDLHITGCHVDGKIVVNSTNKNAFTGGLMGYSKVDINAVVVKNCRVDVDINSVAWTTSYVGGMIGTIETGMELSQCVVTGKAYGETLGDANSYTGGVSARLVFNNWIGTASICDEATLMATVGRTVANKLVSSIQVQSEACYGISKYIGNTFTKAIDTKPSECYYDEQYDVDSTLDSYDGEAKSKAELFDKTFLSNTIGLDFQNTWKMILGEPDLISKDPYIAYKADGTTVNIQPVNCGDCKVIAAAYDSDNRVVASRIACYTEGTPATVSFEGEIYESVKIFAFDSNYSPLCKAESFMNVQN